jgi:hypothetical protein
MRTKIITLASSLAVLIGLSVYSLGRPAQTHEMAAHEPHMSAAMGHLEQAKSELERSAPNKGGHREKAIQLVNEAMQQVQQGEAYFEQHKGR